MSDGTESFLDSPSGPVNTGTGDQYNAPTFVLNSLQQLTRVGRSPRAVAHEHLCWLDQRFVEPDHYGRAWELLADTGSVLLTGAPGSGRRATAQMLLHRLDSRSAELIRELPDADTGGRSDGPVLDAHEVESGQRLLLDLSTRDEMYREVVLEQLPLYRDVVRDRGAHLVVVLPRSREHHVSSELGPFVVEIVRRESKEVLQRYLRSDGIKNFTSAQRDVDELTAQLDSEPMRDIARLAGLVRDAREREPAQTFPHWLREARAALIERSGEVAKQVKDLRSGQQRALLLTTAMFSGAHADAIFAATSRLCECVQHPADDRPRLEWEDFAERFAEIDAKDDAAGRVRFLLLDYDQAVRAHFWTNFPDLRGNFRDWVKTALGHATLSSDDRDAVVTRFAEQALRTDRPEDLQLLAEHWASRTDARWPSRLLPQAAKAVGHGLNHEHHGVFFRRQLYEWSRDPGLPPDLAQVVVQVCSEVLALAYPQQALVRLHHIVRRHSGAAGSAARAALLNLTNRDRHLYRFLLDRAARGPRWTEHTAADLALFHDLADPARLFQQWTPPLFADEAVQGQLITGWKAVLGESSSLDCARYVRTWLDACAYDQYREPLLTMLVRAADGRGDLLSRLYVVARDWAHAPDGCREERRKIADRLNGKIDSALGIDLTELELGDRTEGTSP